MIWALYGLLFLIAITGYIVCIQLADMLVHVAAVILLVVLCIFFGSMISSHQQHKRGYHVEETSK